MHNARFQSRNARESKFVFFWENSVPYNSRIFSLTPDRCIEEINVEKRISYTMFARMFLFLPVTVLETISIVCLNSGNLTCYSHEIPRIIYAISIVLFLATRNISFPRARARVPDIMISRWKPFLGIVFIFARAITTKNY